VPHVESPLEQGLRARQTLGRVEDGDLLIQRRLARAISILHDRELITLAQNVEKCPRFVFRPNVARK